MREVSLPFPTPRYCGDFDIHIRRDGTWCYQNSPIRRQALCRLFASVLHKDADGQHWLITPAERGRISVELAPFLIAQCKYTDSELQLQTTLGEWKPVDTDHPVFMERRTPQPPQSFPNTKTLREPSPAILPRILPRIFLRNATLLSLQPSTPPRCLDGSLGLLRARTVRRIRRAKKSFFHS